MIETWTEWSKIYPAVVSDALRAPRKPVVLGEGAYENGPEYPQGPITPLVVRRQAWWTVMAGGFHTYGQDQMWRMKPGWDRTFDTPGAAQVGLMRRIVTALPWSDLVPDQGVFATGVSSERTLKATWISPVTGERKDAGTFATGNLTGSVFPGSPTQFFKTPDFWEDAVLLLEGV